MNWIFDHLQIVVLIALGVGSMLKSVLDKSKTPDEEVEERDYDDVFTSDEEYREVAVPSVPPPIIYQAGPPPLRDSGYEEAVADENAKVLRHQMEIAEALRRIQKTKSITTGGAGVTSNRVLSKPSSKQPVLAPTSIRNRLRNTEELRRSIVMREILDPPVGLR